MSERGRAWLTSLLVAIFSLAVFLPTLNWGLPSRDADRALFGDRKPWSGAEILSLLSESEIGNRQSEIKGADVDANPILDRSVPVILNDTDAKRAEIVQRYRLMSKQPDEFIQFKALAEMSQRQGISKLDPRLYQYGGLWIYPVGALVRGAMLVGYIETPPTGVPAKEFYLDHPEVFGKFYIVARLYSTMWGIVAALAIVWITRRLTNSNVLAALAAIAFILLPVTRTAAHEAKPHLAGAALCLCAVIAGTRYVESGRRRYALLAGALCGAAMAMVVSMLLSLSVLPVMGWLRWRMWRGVDFENPRPRTRGRGQGEGESTGRVQVESDVDSDRPLTLTLSPDYRGEGTRTANAFVFAVATAFLLYALTNPFLLYNAVFHPEILKSNLGNSTAMYGVGNLGEAFTSAVRIAIKGMTLGGVILATISIVVLIVSRLKGATDEYAHPCSVPAERNAEIVEARVSVLARGTRTISIVGWLLATPAVCVLIQFVLLAAGKPAEYARFGLVMFAALAVCFWWTAECSDFSLSSGFGTRRGMVLEYATALLIVVSLLGTLLSVLSSEKRVAGWWLDLQAGRPPKRFGKPYWTLGLSHEPAPWSVMPLNLFRDQLILCKPSDNPKNAIYDVYLYPSNLSSQIGYDANAESIDWAHSRTQMRIGTLNPLPTTKSVESRD